MNTIKTTLLLATLSVLLVLLGDYLGGSQGALMALIIAAIMNFGSYWFSDKIVLSMYRAKERFNRCASTLFHSRTSGRKKSDAHAKSLSDQQ